MGTTLREQAERTNNTKRNGQRGKALGRFVIVLLHP